MEKLQSVPFVFGVTGHRDLREEDIPRLEKSVQALFREYREKYPHTELILISALAEGADMLVARVAKEVGVTLHVLIPYEEEAYLDSFDDEANMEAYRTLKAYASRFEVNASGKEFSHRECYQKLGETITDISNMLIALWDGTDNGKTGGTSAVVNYQRNGLRENRFDALDGNALFIITTPRKSNPDVTTDFTVHKECLGKYVKGETFEKMLQRVDALNAQTTQVVNPSDGNLLQTYMTYFGNTADDNQGKFKMLAKAILILSGIAFASLEFMHVLHIDNFIIGYGLGLLLAFGLYRFFMKNGKVQDDFVHSRGFSEAIRVQNAWNGAGLGKSVAVYYLKDQHHKFTWIKFVLKNLYYIDKEHKPFTPRYDDGSTANDWIEGQIKYFKVDALPKRHKNFEKWEKIEKTFYHIGFVTLLVMFAIFVGESFHLINHEYFYKEFFGLNVGELLEKVGFLQADKHHKHLNWHILVLISGVSLLIAAFIGEKYMKIEGYEEEIYHFNAMLSDFQEAKRALEGIPFGSDAYKKIIFDLGIKALEENSKWVVLHDSMRAKPSLD